MSASDGLVARLRAAGCVYAEDEAALIRAAAASPAEVEAWTARRVAGEPLERIVGWVDFAGVRVLLGPDVFVPRAKTGLLVRLAVETSPELVVDLCCGSGAVGAAVAARVPGAEVWASDLEAACVACARRNLPPDRVVQGDLFDGLPAHLRGRVDVVTANAPYVPTAAIPTLPTEARDHEPLVALDGGRDGIDLHRRIAAEAGAWLRPGGRLIIETGPAVAHLTAAGCRGAGLEPRVVRDEDLEAVAVVAVAPASPVGSAP